MAQAGYSRRRFILSAATLACTRALRGQEEQPTFSTDVKVVQVLATVTTKKGQIIRDLTKDDFVLAENGRKQTIQYFSRDSDLPLTIGLMVDTSMSQQRVMNAERSASARFFEQVLRPNKDQVFIVQFDMAVMIRQELTSSLRKLSDALVQVDTPSRADLYRQQGGGTLLYDAVIKASKDLMQHQQGRKALILLTDGVDTGSDATLADAIDAAQLADTLIYSILFSDATFYALSFEGGNGKNVLMRMSRETGGGFFEVSKKQSIEQIYGAIQDELRSQYSLGYVSDTPVRVSEFRKIALTTDKKDLVVHARDRYWARKY
ncbi:MAG TPA: VWA domain-containing protein [Bryobacteraceae bacterium]|nr:VWA domain-containing protein [Bryobacteraceae bacterium]